jgi:uncharacterized protein (TIGR00369 family)
MFRLGCPLLSSVSQQTVLRHTIESAERLLHTEAPIFAPAMLGHVEFQPRKVTQRGAAMVFPFHGGKQACNAFQSVHGGALAALADMFTTLHLWGQEPQSRHVSVNLDIQYLSAAKVGGSFECVTRVTKKGKRLAFTEFEFFDQKSGDIVCKGTHTKAFI